jgi:hypothetical protein
MRDDYHIGRHWSAAYRGTGKTIEDQCPCPVEPCGLIDAAKVDPHCPQHSMGAARTIRSSHPANMCPGAEARRPNA